MRLVLFFGFITGVSLLFLFFGKQLQDALAFGFVHSLLKQQAVMFYVLSPNENGAKACLHWAAAREKL
jgi:hypothetical protein